MQIQVKKKKKKGIPAAPPSGNIRKSYRVPQHTSSDLLLNYSNIATKTQTGLGMCQKSTEGFAGPSTYQSHMRYAYSATPA